MSTTKTAQLDQYAFRALVDQVEKLTPGQIESLLGVAYHTRRRFEATAAIEARTEQEHKCPHCSAFDRQRWGRTRLGIQRYKCLACHRTFTGRTGTVVAHLHRPDRFLDLLRNMMSDRPLSCRKLAAKLKTTKDTIWRWRILALGALGQMSDTAFAGIVEADETHQRESRKGSREWSRHRADPITHGEPPRLQWYRYKNGRIKMKRGLSRWQIPVMTVMDRSGSRYLEQIPDRKVATIDAALSPIIARDAIFCSDSGAGYLRFGAKHHLVHRVLVAIAGQRLIDGAYHIQTVNSLHARFSAFIRPFCGPATKYLPLFLRWFLAQNRLGATEAFEKVLRAPN